MCYGSGVMKKNFHPCPRVVALISIALFALFALVGLACAAPAFAFASVPSTATPAPAPASPSPSARVVETGVDRATPRRAFEGFLRSAHDGDSTRAAEYLDLRGVPAGARGIDGRDLASKLEYVLAHRAAIDLAKLSDAPEGDPASKTPGSVIAETIYVDEEPVPISLTRVRFNDGVDRWLISRTTVSMIPALDAALGPRKLAVSMPAALQQPIVLGNAPWQWLGLGVALIGSFLVGWALEALLAVLARFATRRTKTKADDALVSAARHPVRLILAAALFRAALDPLSLTVSAELFATRIAYTALVIGAARLVLATLGVLGIWLEERLPGGGGVGGAEHDELRTRGIRTQATLLQRVAWVITIFVAGAVILIQFDFVRDVGVSLLASAGLVSVVLGFAAQKTLGGIFAGIQLSVAQPIRIGDSVQLEGEFGEVEEISLTYVVLKLWDGRRMIVPITYFLEKPFQNWTRGTSDLVGAVILKVDYAIPVERVRDALEAICASDPAWDKNTCSLQVTDSDGASITLRALVSATNSSRSWDLRCRVRERLVEFIRSLDDGRYLPRARHVVQSAA
jgi:small-conductance mechanosensitive channel